jgi:ABC-type Fe3+-citrate transport system substrate-binding protein
MVWIATKFQRLACRCSLKSLQKEYQYKIKSKKTINSMYVSGANASQRLLCRRFAANLRRLQLKMQAH